MSSPAASHENVSLLTELDRWSAAGRTARLWLRDDDAVAPTPALDALLSRLRAHEAPCLLAVIPLLVEPALADRLREEPLVRVAMHGVRHLNHALPGGRKAETPMERGLDAIVSEWTVARRRLIELFGPEAGHWYVPPWNRIGPEVAVKLADIGFRAVSTFAANDLGLAPPMLQRNTHVDIIDWRGGRIGRPAGAVLGDLADALGLARRDHWRPVGILLHHLVHDATAWATLDAIMDEVSTHPAARWSHPDKLLSG